MPNTIPVPLGPFLTQLHRDDATPDAASLRQGWFSWVLSELWFPHLREAPILLDAAPLAGSFPALAAISKDALPDLFAGEATISIPREAWVRELRMLSATLRRLQGRGLTKGGLWRFFFAPLLPPGTPQPVYSQCQLRTGQMIAGFDLCRINRNWDGIDRVEDLTTRDVFTDASGDIAIVKQHMATHLCGDLLALADTLERLPGETCSVTFSRYPKEEAPEQLAWSVLQRAEHWRVRWGIQDYHPAQIEQVNRRWRQLIAKGQGNVKEAVDLGAYLAEVMRAGWGGQYRIRRDDAGEKTGVIIADELRRGRRKGHSQEAPEGLDIVALELQLPFDCSVAPMEKALRSWRQRRKIDWSLQHEVLKAQRRQRRLLMSLGQQLFAADPARNHAALRLLDEVQDRRVDLLMIEALERPELSPRDAMHMMERLAQSRVRVPAAILVPKVLGEHVGVAARALWLLGQQGWEQLPELLARRLAGRAMLPLRPLARKLLTDLSEHPRFANDRKRMKGHTKKVLRSLGPIPPAVNREQLLPDGPPPLLPLPMLSERLEDSSNPKQHDTALRIVMMFPNRDEAETLGAALADPDPELRMAVIGLLASCDGPLAKQLLETRAMFEQEPLCQRLIRLALATFASPGAGRT